MQPNRFRSLVRGRHRLPVPAGQRGQATTEYILIVAMLVIPIAVAFNKLRDVLADLLQALFVLVQGPGV